MHSYRLKREERNWYDNRRSYLASRSSIPVGEPAFCHAIEFASADAPEKDLTSEKIGGMDATEAWSSFPWATLVLGSGCLELRDQYEFTAQSVAAGVEQRLLELLGPEPPPYGEHPATLARTFTMNLVSARLPQAREDGSDVAPGVTVDPLAARMALLAARLTILYHWASAGGLASMSRWDDDAARLDPDRTKRPRELQDIDELLIDPLQRERAEALREIERAADATSENEVRLIYEGVATLLRAVGENLALGDEFGRDLRISRGHVRVLTEIAWFLLVRHSTVYPGWTESLLRLILQQNSAKLRSQRRMSPLLRNLVDTHRSVRLFMEPATEASWQRLQAPDEQPSARNRLYHACASLLYAQQDVALRWQQDGTGGRAVEDKRLPTPSAYVSSFDLELEMAMWREGCRRRGGDDVGAAAFSVVVPVHVLPENASDAEFCWLRADIVPDPGTTELSALRQPRRWRVARDEDEAPERPVIVHLNGAPLFDLPRFVDEVEGLADDLEDLGVLLPAGLRDEDARYSIVHAVTVDEYLARRQSERELTWLSMGSDGEQRFVRRALPSNLQRDNLSRRFWIVLGVPIADPAVRTRVMAHLMPRPTAELRKRATPVGPLFGDDDESDPPVAVPPPSQEMERGGDQADVKRSDGQAAAMGVAVNRRIDNDEASLLYWLGLDVVRTDVHDFVADLEHYADHLRDDGAPALAAYEEVCRLTDEVDR